MKRFFTLTIFLILFILSSFAQGQWPKVITSDDGSKISVYEPQPEFISGDQFTGRAAISVKKSSSGEPVFGAILFTATLDEKKPAQNIDVETFRVTRLKLAGEENEELLDGFTSAIEENASTWNWGMTGDELREAIEKEKSTADGKGFNNAAPRIIYTEKPSTLIVIDGDPRVLYDKDLATDKVANSPNMIFREKGKWNLYAGGNWYQSNKITEGWQINKNLSPKVRSVGESIRKQEKENNDGKSLESDPRPTEIIVVTEPAELLQTDGEPEFKNVAGTSLLYVSNSPNQIFKDINTQRTYILIAGRWYYAKGLNGPWEYIPADKLPEDFARIPEGSEKDQVLANVAGTEAARTAILDAAIPQTAKVDRRTATIDVEYDGEPIFNRIRGTSLSLAENSNVTVIRDSDGYYFALDNGIWFISDDPYGPWSVANDRPRDLDDIPASSPAYYSRYVEIYDVTPEYVYMGYTPGYLGSYVYGPTIIYGTGYHYRPWFRRVYYPRPFTWGFGFLYDPWYGWNYNFGYNYGYMYLGFNFGRPAYYGYGGGWFGPSRYCPSYYQPYWGRGYYGRGGYYYGRRSDVYGARPRRDYYGSSQGGGRNLYGRNFGNNVYAEQRGVTSTTVSRSTRLYRPGQNLTTNGNLSTPVNGRYRNRLGEGNNDGRVNQPVNGSRPERNAIQRPDLNNGERPRLSDPRGSDEVSERRNSTIQRPDIDRRERPVLRDPQSSGEERRRIERPSLNNRLQERSGSNNEPVDQPRRNEGGLQRPDINRGERPTLQNPQRTERSTPPRVERPSFERQPAPSRSERPSFERQSAPARAERPTFERQSAPPPRTESRPAPPRNAGGNAPQSTRPDRR